MTRSAARAVILAGQAVIAAVSAYLLTLTAAAFFARRRSPGSAWNHASPELVVLVPAHDEEEGIHVALSSLAGLDYPSERYEVIVLADNCTDATASVARFHGARVMERAEPQLRGKGHALAWALPRVLDDRPRARALVIVDADCRCDPQLLNALAARLDAGAAVVQANYTVANPDASAQTALRYAAFAVINTARPLGKQALGLSAGLFGPGIAYRRDILELIPWRADSLAEDTEYHLRLVAGGQSVTFAPETWVTSDMPTRLRDSSQQQARWEGGGLQLARRWSAQLLRTGVRQRDLNMIHSGLEILVPSQSMLMSANIVAGALAAVLGVRGACRMAVLNGLAQAAVVLGALRISGAPPSVYRALGAAPVLVARNLVIYGRALLGRGPKTYLRTPRSPRVR